MKKLILLLMVVVAISCTSKDTVKFTIAPTTVRCTGSAPQDCMQVKKGNSDQWEYFYDTIEGFNYEKGYEYVLEVKEEKVENPPADASSIRYILVKEISKVKK